MLKKDNEAQKAPQVVEYCNDSYWYIDLFGAIINQAICDYRQFKNYKHGEKHYAYISARSFLFEAHELEHLLNRYGLNNILSIDYVRSMANKAQDEYINPQAHMIIDSENNTQSVVIP